jgi:hypothetical protein
MFSIVPIACKTRTIPAAACMNPTGFLIADFPEHRRSLYAIRV